MFVDEAVVQVAGGVGRVFIGEGKDGHQRIEPVSGRFFNAVGDYLDIERPAGVVTDRLFVALKGRRRGEPLSAYGVDETLPAHGGALG